MRLIDLILYLYTEYQDSHFHPFVMNMKNIYTYYISMSIEGVVYGRW